MKSTIIQCHSLLTFLIILFGTQLSAVAEIRLLTAYYFSEALTTGAAGVTHDRGFGAMGSTLHRHSRSVATYGSPATEAEAWEDVITKQTQDGFSLDSNLGVKVIRGVNSYNYPIASGGVDFVWRIQVVGQEETVTIDPVDPVIGFFINGGLQIVNGSVISSGWSSGSFTLQPGNYEFKITHRKMLNSGSTDEFLLHYVTAVHFTNLVKMPGSSEDNPVLGTPMGGEDSGWSFVAGLAFGIFDPPLSQGYTFTTTGSALFKQILAFPSGIPANYTVITEGTTLGPFTPKDSVNFVALLGHGVTSFEVRGIKPFVDATSPVAFPIMLDFTEPTASFTMIPIAAPDITIETLTGGDMQLKFKGILQYSPDLVMWSDVSPTPTSPYVIQKANIGAAKYFRARDP